MRVNPAVVVKGQAWGGAGYPYGESSLCCSTTMSEAENALGGAFCKSPGVLLLPATDGSNCAETHVSGALIIYAVCCMLLSKVPCSTVSAYIFGMSGPRGTV